jgi:hypothetical protein
MKAPSIFSPRVMAIWLAAVILLFAGTLYFTLFGSPPAATGPSAFSISAVGYAGIADVMHRLGARVIKSRGDTLNKLDPQGVLIVAEPLPGVSAQQLRALFAADRVLLVLPKWVWAPSPDTPGWIAGAALAPLDVAKEVAKIGVSDSDVVRVPPAATWSKNEIGGQPNVTDQLQLIKSPRLRPVVGTADGMLIGELRTGRKRLWILADPDVMQNHGLTQNAAFAVALINALRGGDGNVVFDETVHGFTDRPSPFWLLFEFPFVLATALGTVAIALLLWATMGRFGVPLTPPQALQSGKTVLIGNTAKLFEFARYQPVIVKRYVYAIIGDVARQLHAPSGLSDASLIEWLRRNSQSRALDVDCGTLLASADHLAAAGGRSGFAPLAAVARDIFRWKREMIDGVPRDPRPHRSDPERGAAGRGRAGRRH